MRVCSPGGRRARMAPSAFFCTRRTAVPPGRLFRTEAPRERQGRCGLSELCLQRPAVRPWWHGRIEPDFFIEDRRTLRDTNLADNEPVSARDHAYVAVVSTAQRAYDVAEVTRIGRHCGRLALHEVVQFVVVLTNRTLGRCVGRGSSSGGPYRRNGLVHEAVQGIELGSPGNPTSSRIGPIVLPNRWKASSDSQTSMTRQPSSVGPAASAEDSLRPATPRANRARDLR